MKRKNCRSSFWLSFFVLCTGMTLLPLSVKAQVVEQGDSVRVLFIGNSYIYMTWGHKDGCQESVDDYPPVAGSYLAANVIFATLFQKPYQTTCTKGLDVEQAEYLQQVAQQTVFGNRKLLNLE